MATPISSLIGVQVDYTKLDNQLQQIINGQNELRNSVRDILGRLQELEQVSDRHSTSINNVDRALGQIGGTNHLAEDLRNLTDNVKNLTQNVGQMQRNDLPNMNKAVSDLHKNAEHNQRQMDQLSQIVPNLERSVGEAHRMAEAANQDLTNNVHANLRDLTNNINNSQRGLEQKQRGIENFQADVNELTNRLSGRVDNIERTVQQKLGSDGNTVSTAELEDLSSRMDDNFREVERQLSNVDADMKRQQTDSMNLRADLNASDNDKTTRINETNENLKAQIAMLLQTMQEFENNNNMTAQIIADAGRKLSVTDRHASVSAANSAKGINSGTRNRNY